MTIKQQGGIFGRNPTFNSVTVENSGANPLTLIRSSSNGDIAEFRKGTTTVGSVGTTDGADIYIGSEDTGLRFGKGADAIWGVSYGVTRDGGISLGWSGGRFKDLYLSGNVVVASGSGIDFSATSGTGTSELFDDYEEGNWTPSLVAGVGTLGSTSTAGTYTKVGRVVTLSAYLKITDNGTGSTYLRVNNLPFPVASYGGSTSAYENGVSGSATSIYVVNGGSYFTMWKYDNTYPGATNATWYVSVSYFTT